MKVSDFEQGLICKLVKLWEGINLVVDIDDLDPDLSGFGLLGLVKFDEEEDLQAVNS